MRAPLIGKHRGAEYIRNYPQSPAYRDGRCDGNNSRGRRLAPARESAGLIGELVQRKRSDREV